MSNILTQTDTQQKGNDSDKVAVLYQCAGLSRADMEIAMDNGWVGVFLMGQVQEHL